MSLAEAGPVTPSSQLSSAPEDSSFDDTTPQLVNEMTTPADGCRPVEADKKLTKGKKRAFLGLGKKKEDAVTATTATTSSADEPRQPRALPSRTSKPSSTTQPATWSGHGEQPVVSPSSPTNRAISSSPRVSSPAGSQIFERDVQSSAALKPNSAAIPTHIQTENYIPPVLGDASDAITNENLNPDSVEIVTHTLHQPASVTVTSAANGSAPYDQSASDWAAELASFSDRDAAAADNASNYGSLDSNDVRRLSFISFADVVQSEHSGPAGAAGSRDSIHLAGLTSLPPALNRSPSPIRSPVSSQGPGTSPPTSNPGSMKGVDLSPSRKPMSSPHSSHYGCTKSGDLNIETMSQALRRTGSKDLSQARSLPHSPV